MADIPRFGALAPDQERQFQLFMGMDPSVRAWKNGFQNKYGEQPDTTNDPTFDYRQAFLAGNKPQAYGYDTMPHWDSRGKAPDHQTAWMNDFMQQFGVDPNALQPHQVTPAMQQFMMGIIPQTVASPFAQTLQPTTPQTSLMGDLLAQR